MKGIKGNILPYYSLILYAVSLSVFLIFLKFIEYRYFFFRSITVDVYLALFSLFLISLGIWIGNRFGKKPLLKRDAVQMEVTGKYLLTEREKEILVHMAEGLSNQEIADRLFISLHTVKTHSANLFQKLDVKRRTQAVKKAQEMGVLKSMAGLNE